MSGGVCSAQSGPLERLCAGSAVVRSPQPALLAMVKSLQCEWMYLNELLMHGCGVTLDNVIIDHFLPAIFDGCAASNLVSFCLVFLMDVLFRKWPMADCYF